MKNYDFDWQINEFMVYCRSTQLRERTMYSYEQTLRLFERWLCDELKIYSVDKVTENMIRKYINDLQERGKYTLTIWKTFEGSIALYIEFRYNNHTVYFHLRDENL